MVFAFFLFILATFLVIALVADKKKRRQSFVIPGSFVGLLLLLIVGAKCAWQSDIEWNPIILGDGVVVGTWRDSSQTLVLKLDHTFSFRTTSQNLSGTWTRDDWNLHLQSDQYLPLMRFVKFHAHYRLMTEPPDDPDAWNGNAGLDHVQK